MRRHRQQGFTLIELLVAMALIGIVLTALVSFFSQGSRVSAQSSGRAELQQEVLTAQQLIAGKLKEAFYIYPPGSPSFSLTSSDLTKNPITNGNTWSITSTTTNNHPMLAMILPPRNTSLTCVASTTAVPDPDGCYRFVAYYPVKRSVWLTGTAADSVRNPGPDTANADTWVLAEYRRVMPSTFVPSGFPFPTVPTPPTGTTANILADYIAPTTASGATYTMFTYTTATSAATTTTPATTYVTGVTLNLATTRNVGGKVLRLPGATGTYSITIYPTNLGKVAAN